MNVANNRYNHMSCPVCWDTFNIHELIRTIKPCDHVLCDPCYEEIVFGGGPHGHPKCPTCRDLITEAEATPFRTLIDVDAPTPPDTHAVPAPTPQVNVSPLQLPLVAFNTSPDDGIRVTGSNTPAPTRAPRRVTTSRPVRRRRRTRTSIPATRAVRPRVADTTRPFSYQLSQYIELRAIHALTTASEAHEYLDSIPTPHPGAVDIIVRLRELLNIQTNADLDHLYNHHPSPTNNV